MNVMTHKQVMLGSNMTGKSWPQAIVAILVLGQLLSIVQAGDAGTQFDAGESFSEAFPLQTENHSFIGGLSSSDREDFYKLDMMDYTSISVRLELSGSSDYDLYLYYENESIISQSLSSSSQTEEVDSNGTETSFSSVYIRVKRWSGSGNYSLDIWLHSSLQKPSINSSEVNIIAMEYSAITDVNFTNDGDLINSYSFEPNLPEGLEFNLANMTLFGTLTIVSQRTEYRFWANNSGGDSYFDFNITVNEIPLEPPIITANIAQVSYTENLSISSIIIYNNGGEIDNWSIIPELPNGLNFSANNSSIWGTPTTSQPNTEYTITAYNLAGNDSFSLTMGIFIQPPLIQPQQIFINLSRGELMDGSFFENTGGIIESWSIEPPLPSGLLMNNSSGIIYGEGEIAANSTHTIFANNSRGSSSAILTLSITESPIPGPYLIIAKANHTFTRNNQIETIVFENVGGSVQNWSIAPSLPTGLEFNFTTGEISGTPIVVSPITTYHIWANNTYGRFQANLNITINSEEFYINFPIDLIVGLVANTSIELEMNRSIDDGFEYSISPTLPNGIFFTSENHTLWGIATENQIETSYNFSVNFGGIWTQQKYA